MQPYQIILLVIGVAILIAAVFFISSQHYAKKKRAELPRKIGVITGQIPSKLPWFEQYQMAYTEKGRPHACMTTIYKKTKFKPGMKVPIVITTIKQKGQTYPIAYIMQKK